MDKVFHVYSGVDAFVIEQNGEKLYLPYIPIIATTTAEARIKTATLLGQSLEDQDTNESYKNYVSNHVVYIEDF